mgnify:CR=1 FL=1
MSELTKIVFEYKISVNSYIVSKKNAKKMHLGT